MYKYQCQYENMVIDFHLEHLLHRIHTRLDARRLTTSRKGLMSNQELIGVIHNMDWIRKHMQNKDNTGVVKTWSSDQNLFQAKVDRQLADDFKLISIALGLSQKELLSDWMTKFVHDFKRSALS